METQKKTYFLIFSMHDASVPGKKSSKFPTAKSGTKQLLLKGILKVNSQASSKHIDITTFKSKEVAKQITLLEFEIFERIRPRECLNQAWNKQNRETKAPNIFATIRRTNFLVNLVTNEILKYESLKDRQKALKKFVKIAEECRKLGNYNAVLAMVGGLRSVSVHRLKKTWEGLSQNTLQLFSNLEKLVNQEQNYRLLREVIKTQNPPCIPYIGVYLQDLTFIEDGNQDLVNNKIHFFKRRKLGIVIRNIQRFQQFPYNFTINPEIRSKLANTDICMDEDMQYELSLEREPKKPIGNTFSTPISN